MSFKKEIYLLESFIAKSNVKLIPSSAIDTTFAFISAPEWKPYVIEKIELICSEEVNIISNFFVWKNVQIPFQKDLIFSDQLQGSHQKELNIDNLLLNNIYDEPHLKCFKKYFPHIYWEKSYLRDLEFEIHTQCKLSKPSKTANAYLQITYKQIMLIPENGQKIPLVH